MCFSVLGFSLKYIKEAIMEFWFISLFPSMMQGVDGLGLEVLAGKIFQRECPEVKHSHR